MSRKYKKIIDDEYKQSRDYFRKAIEEQYQKDINKKTGTHSTLDDIAPVKKKEKERTWFSTGAFDDGYDFGDVTKSILGTIGDVGSNVMEGVATVGHNVAGLTAGGVAEVADFIGQDDYANKVRNRLAGKDEETNEFLNKYSPKEKFSDASDFFGGNSLLGEKSDNLASSAGSLMGAMALQSVGVPGIATMGLQAAGGELENAYKSGATSKEAWTSAAVTGISEAVIERLSGGISFGAKTLDELWKEPLTKAITNRTANTFAKYGLDILGEGAEEVITEAVQSLGRLSYEDKSVREALFSEEARDNYIEAFIGGGIIGGGFSAKRAYDSVKTGRDYDTGLSANEQRVIDSEVKSRTAEKQKKAAVEAKVSQIINEREATLGNLTDAEKKNIRQNVQTQLENGQLDYSKAEIDKKELAAIEKQVREDLDRGDISIDTIEGTLAGQKTAQINDLKAELSKTTNEAKRTEIQAKLNELTADRATQMQELLRKDVYLQESYRQEALKSQEFTREVTDKDSDITKELIESTKSVKMNDTRKMHDLFEYTNKIANDSGTKYGFVNNEQLKELGHAVEGTTINGLVRTNKDGSTKVLINVDSNKALNAIIGHETTHLLEGTSEYKALQDIVKQYATTKGDYDVRLQSMKKLYEGVDANLENEITADLVGDYLFTDEQFIKELTADRNVFQKIYDYVKRAYKMATAGSKEKRELEKVKRSFEKAYKEISKTTTQQTKDNSATDADSNTLFSVTKDKNGNDVVVIDQNIYDGMLDSEKPHEYIAEFIAAEIGNSYNIIESGQSVYIGEDLPSEFTQSKYTQNLKARRKDLLNAKNQSAQNLKDIVEIATNRRWEKNTKAKHNVDAKYGFYKYTSRFAIDKGNGSGPEYEVTLVIRNDADGKKYLYDITDIKKVGSLRLTSTSQRSHGYVGGNTPPQSNPTVNSVPDNAKEGNNKYSFSGETALTANGEYLKKAKSMDAEGVDSEHIRTETGWFKGYDGKWRFEIDDSDMEVDAAGNFHRNPDIRRYTELTQKYFYDKTATEAEKQEFWALDKALAGVSLEVRKLGDLMRHPKLFEAYPSLEDVRISYTGNDNGELGRYSPKYDDIILQRKLFADPEELKKVLMHEIQHAIQQRESFANGASPSYWESMLEDGYDSRPESVKAEQRELQNEYLRLVEEDRQFVLDMEELTAITPDVPRGKIDWDTLEQIEEDPIEWQIFDQKRDELEEKYGDKVYDFFNLQYSMEAVKEKEKRSARDLYFKTAGEIEARDVENRLPLNEEQRRGKRPNIDERDVVFTEGTRYSLSQKEAEYKSAVENGDTETARMLVDEAAKNAGYTIKAYHGTGYDFTVFDPAMQGSNYEDWGRLGKGFYFAPDERQAKTWAEMSSGDSYNVMAVYLKDEGLLDAYSALPEDLVETIPSDWDPFTARMAAKYAYNYIEYMQEFGYDVQAIMKEKGYKGVKEARSEYVIFDPENIKSADPVTYDDDGNVIPLSERFSPENLDTRYSVGDSDVAPTGSYNVYRSDVLLPEAQTVPEVPAEAPVEEVAPVVIPEELRYEEGKPLSEEDLPYVEQERDEAFYSITEDYAPVEEDGEFYSVPNTAALDDKSLRMLAKNMREELNLKPKQVKSLEKIIQDFSTSEEATRETLYEMIEEEFGTVYVQNKINEVVQVKKDLRELKVKVSDTIKGDIPDYFQWKQKNFGKIRFSNQGLPVDDVYEGLKSFYPGLFPADIINPTDQLLKMAEVADLDSVYTEEYSLPEKQIQEVTDFILESVHDYKREAAMKASHEAGRAPIDESMIPFEPKVKREIAPSNFDPNDFTVSRGVQQEYDAEAGEIVDDTHDIELERLERRKKKAMDDLGDLTSYTKQQAQALYDEVRMMQKGKKVSADLGFILDRMFDGVDKKADNYEEVKDATYKKITDALLAIERSPAKPEKNVPPTESLIRNSIETKYGWRVSEIEGMKLDSRAEARRNLRKELVGVNSEGLTKALDNAKNIPMALMNNTDTIRNTELVFGRENGKIINEAIFQKEIDNESKSIAWQNKERAEIKELGIKARSKESAAVQKYGEKQYVNEFGDLVKYGEDELIAEFPNAETQAKIRQAARIIREKYDEYIDLANETLTKLGFDPIKKRNDYMRHFQELNDVFSRYGIPFNAEALQEHDLPTDINGLTDSWSPQKNYFANMQPRKGQRTTLDAVTGIDGYIGGIANLIYHTEDIQRGRAFEEIIRETYGQEKGWENLEKMEELSPEEYQARADKIQDNHLSNYAAWVHEWTNNIAGKKSKVDRSIESMFGRKAFALLDQTRKQVGANMIGFNLSSSLTNLVAPVQAAAKTNKLALAKGTADTIKNIFVKDNFTEKNSFLTARMGTDMLSKTAWEKVQDAGYVFMKGMDWFSSNQIVRSKYYELRAKGMSEEQAHAEAGKFAARIMGDRTKGAQAQLYNSKLIGLVTQFQLEVNNQLYSMFYDTYHESKENAKNNAARTAAGMTFTLGQLAALTHVFGKTFEAIAGYNPTFDIIGIIATALGAGDDDDEKTTGERLKDAADKLVDALPYVNILTGGGRIPIASGIPNPIGVMTGGKDEYGNELTWGDEAKKLLYLIPPTGGNQAKKTYQGLSMFDGDLPVSGSYTGSGNLRYPVEDTPINRAQAALFGQYASGNARDYFDNERDPLKEKQIQEYADLDIPIADYWKYREGLKDQETVEDKFDYIAGLDLPVSKKNIMINNIVDREEEVDLTNYSDFGSYEEFDFAANNPEKYSFLQANDVTYEEYNRNDVSRDAYNWAFKNQEGYTVSRAVSDVVTYRQIAGSLYDIKADKDSEGKSISGSRKEKVLDYINGLDLDYGARLILFKSEYPSYDDANMDIIDYLNNRDDISYEDMVTILTELEFTVDAEGNIYW